MKKQMVVAILLFALLLGTGITTTLALPAQEMALNPAGTVFEIHPDTEKNLWISDYLAGEIWKVNANGSGYTIYSVGNAPSDATPDTAGGVWWVDGTKLNRLAIVGGATQSWELSPAANALWGVGIDSLGKIWLTDSITSSVFRFDPAQTASPEICAYAIPSGGLGLYPAVKGTRLWLGDSVNARMWQLDFATPSAAQWTWWALPANAEPFQAVVDSLDNVWYADHSLGQLGRLATGSNALTVYPVPSSGSPWMLAAAGAKIWFTDQILITFGVLDPSQASATPQGVAHGSVAASSVCTPLAQPTTGSATLHTGTSPTWQSTSYTTLTSANGWRVYQLPTLSQPIGIAATDAGFVVDAGRQKLLRFTLSSEAKLYLPMVRR